MLGMNEKKIYENNVLLRSTMMKIFSSYELNVAGILFVNISYTDNQDNRSFYSGMLHVADLRRTTKDNSPVLFYGFEDLARLKYNREASILNSPAVAYIKMPFLVQELEEKIKRVKAKEGSLDNDTRRKLALRQISIFKHDILNAKSDVEIVYKLTRSGTKDDQKLYWNSVRTSLFKAKHLITDRMSQFDNNISYFLEFFPEQSIKIIENYLLQTKEKYTVLIKKLEKFSDKNLREVIKKAGEIIELLDKIKTTLGEIKT